MAEALLPDSGLTSDDRFYRGTIWKLFRGSRSGIVRSAKGREISFVFAHVVMLGRRRRFDQLREGLGVGFDVGWTSNGLRVTVLRLEEDSSATPESRSGRGDSDP